MSRGEEGEVARLGTVGGWEPRRQPRCVLKPCIFVIVYGVDISFDHAKRATTLALRGLDFADAGIVFAGRTVTVQDLRRDYGEDRFITAGHLARRCVVLVWTPRGGARRIISMRYAHADEEQRWFG